MTGSKGKGSTARLLAGMLQREGYRVGLFTSPHLIDFTERIRVDGRAIEEAEFTAILESLRGALEAVEQSFLPAEYFGPVGIMAVVACLHFAQKRTDVNVIELGRGARYDDVNQVAAEWAVVTPVQWEHSEQLGPDIASIAYNKAGAIMPGLRGVTVGRQEPLPLAILRAEAEARRVPALCFGSSFSVERVAPGTDGTVFDARIGDRLYERLRTPLLGRNQADNIAVALATATAFTGRAPEETALRAHLADLTFPGRCQLLDRRPAVLIDGAINRDSAANVREVAAALRRSPVVAVVAVPRDKDYRGAIGELAAVADELILTRARNPHLCFPDDAAAFAAGLRPTRAIPDFAAAAACAERAAGRDGLVLVAGTQSMVAEALAHYRVATRDSPEFFVHS